MVALCNRADHIYFHAVVCSSFLLLWSPYVIGRPYIYIHPVSFFFLLFFISSRNLSGQRLDVYHTSTHGVALLRI